MLEIERKFLVRSLDWGPVQSSRPIEQGYIFVAPDRSLRVRRSGDSFVLTLKVSTKGLGRHEIELPIDAKPGQRILDRLCTGQVISKTRHLVTHADKTWEIDVFEGANKGLIVAEIELASEDEAFDRPGWLGPEVTGDGRMLNAALSRRPFRDWGVTYDELLADAEGGTA